MPTTYEPIATTTLGSAQSSVTFSSISGSYTDLVLIVNASNTAGNQDLYLQFNSDTAANYSRTMLRGNGTAASSFRVVASSGAYLDYATGTTTTAGEYNSVTSIMNYSNTTTYKTLLTRENAASLGVGALVNLWRSTSAITTIDIKSTGTFALGSTFTLYGIKAA